MERMRVDIGDVIQIPLPAGTFAYARVLRGSYIAVYSTTTDEPGRPPVGSRDFLFVVGFYSDLPGSSRCPIVGHDPGPVFEDDWPPPQCIEDVITGHVQMYYKGEATDSTPEACDGLERVAAWDLHHVINRIIGLRDHRDDTYHSRQ